MGGKSSSATNSTNTTDYSTKSVSSSTSNNTSTNSTTNNTSTNTQDQRMVNDHGIGISAAANSQVTTSDSNNSTTVSNDSHNSTVYNTVSDQGAIAAGAGIAANAITAFTTVSDHQIAAGNMLAQSGLDTLKANIDYAKHLSDENNQLARDAIAQVAQIAAKPLNAQDPQHILVIVGLVVFGVFALKGFK